MRLFEYFYANPLPSPQDGLNVRIIICNSLPLSQMLGIAKERSECGNSPKYLFSDTLGSTVLMEDSNVSGGEIRDEARYKPFGDLRFTQASSGTSLPTDLLYTGQRKVDDVGLYYYNARWVDVTIGHFTQPDTVIPSPYDPASWDRFAYTSNNPVMHNDPSGHKECFGESDQSTCNYDAPVDWFLWRLDRTETSITKNVSTVVPPWRIYSTYIDILISLHNLGRDDLQSQGKLNEDVLISFILSEFQNVSEYGNHPKQQATEALSNQYHSDRSAYNHGCNGNCGSVSNQLGFMSDIEVFWAYSGNSIVNNYITQKDQPFIANTTRQQISNQIVSSGYIFGANDAWSWGNYQAGSDIDTDPSWPLAVDQYNKFYVVTALQNQIVKFKRGW